MSAFKSLSDVAPLPIWPGVLARAVEGREMTFAVVELDAHAVVAEHRHPNEQIGIVLSGTLTFTIGGEAQDLRAGDTYVIPADVPHQAAAGPAGTVVIDVFAPTRGDWSRFHPVAPRTPVWP
jgi:quercetin dioxygenase-like cupin family protein